MTEPANINNAREELSTPSMNLVEKHIPVSSNNSKIVKKEYINSEARHSIIKSRK